MNGMNGGAGRAPLRRVLVTEPIHPKALAYLRAAPGYEVIFGPEIGPSEIPRFFDEADALLVRTMKVPAPAFLSGRLAIVSKHGVGTDNIPLAAARDAGVVVTNTPDANAISVAEHALSLMLALAKALPRQNGRSRPDPGAHMVDLAGRRLLLVGYGRSARRLAAIASVMGMAVTVHSPRLQGPATDEGFLVAPDLAGALGGADVLSLHCPLNDSTRGLIGRAELAALPQGAFVINCARGGLIDEEALAAALRSGHLGGVGVDVYAEEPMRPDHPLIGLPGAILTPHTAAMSDEALLRMGMKAVDNILDHFAGRHDPGALVVAPQDGLRPA